jgi:hypothetical protein
MTANELAEIADGLSCEIPIREWIDNEPKNVMNDIATMLRQQQAEIETLKEARCVACGWNPNLIGGEK